MHEAPWGICVLPSQYGSNVLRDPAAGRCGSPSLHHTRTGQSEFDLTNGGVLLTGDFNPEVFTTVTLERQALDADAFRLHGCCGADTLPVPLRHPLEAPEANTSRT